MSVHSTNVPMEIPVITIDQYIKLVSAVGDNSAVNYLREITKLHIFYATVNKPDIDNQKFSGQFPSSLEKFVQTLPVEESLNRLPSTCSVPSAFTFTVTDPTVSSDSIVSSTSVGNIGKKPMIAPKAVRLRSSAGYCYSAIYREPFKDVCVLRYGPWPTIATILKSPAEWVEDIELLKMLNIKKVNCPNRYHITKKSQGIPFLSSLMAIVFKYIQPRGSFGFFLQNSLLQSEEMQPLFLSPMHRIGGEVFDKASENFDILPSTELSQLLSLDFDSCRCRIHSKPKVFTELGCNAKTSPKNSVFKFAYDSKHHACTADEGTRLKDKSFLKLMCQSHSVNQHLNKDPCSVASNYESLRGMSVGDAGPGYCYLSIIRPKLRFRVARLLGPNPLINDVVLAIRVAGLKEFKIQMLVHVESNFYHIKSSEEKGINSKAGALFEDILVRAVKDSGKDIRVGMSITDHVVQSDCIGNIVLKNTSFLRTFPLLQRLESSFFPFFSSLVNITSGWDNSYYLVRPEDFNISRDASDGQKLIVTLCKFVLHKVYQKRENSVCVFVGCDFAESLLAIHKVIDVNENMLHHICILKQFLADCVSFLDESVSEQGFEMYTYGTKFHLNTISYMAVCPTISLYLRVAGITSFDEDFTVGMQKTKIIDSKDFGSYNIIRGMDKVVVCPSFMDSYLTTDSSFVIINMILTCPVLTNKCLYRDGLYISFSYWQMIELVYRLDKTIYFIGSELYDPLLDYLKFSSLIC